jgi:hypothetical protein
MPEIVLPVGHTETDRELAQRIADYLRLDELVVCTAGRAMAPRPSIITPPSSAARTGSLITEVALGLSYLWDAVRLTARGR